ncbi:MAG: preprotein translocase subunit SecE [Deltaproteobacteria bacterium]|nr:preprotein translocase subunit SecE [Deltaproteobacteria bacterium]MBW2138081.1 preprotein translocase subunit SecE [Deltaproteobacteria bacterium]
MKKSTQKKRKRGSRKKQQATPKQNQIEVQDGGSSAVAERETLKKVYPTVSRKEPERKTNQRTSILRYIDVSVQFLREAKIELKKVKWPTRKELLASTAMVIILVLIVALFLGLIDFGLIKAIKNVVG